MFKTSHIRKAFLEFFVERDHAEIKSSSLVPDNDPTLLFTNSGMVQFKDIFTGKKNTSFTRATTSQKCLRAGGKHNDLENVGYTARHHTFFEMLGNFSFGDYFKEEAIFWAFEFVSKILELPTERLLITVHSSDEEAASLWKKIGNFREERIIRIPTSDNFWMMGDTGPCGPCSEIFYDHGEQIPGGPPGSENSDGDRFVEIWNLVFTQFEAKSDGTRVPLERKCIDTGMGLERIAAVMQGVHNNYEIDIFKNLIEDIKNITRNESSELRAHNNVIADHMRAICFMIADGITPSNEGRGYVLRRIIRRALRHGYSAGVKEPFLYSLVKSVKNAMGLCYPELSHFEIPTTEVLKNEEENFMKTIENGMFILNDELSKIGTSSIFPTEVAYKLYDTYGFPLDLTEDILKNHGKSIDNKEFERISQEHRKKSKGAWAGTGDSFTEKVWYDIKEILPEIEFLRNTASLEATILAIIKGGSVIETAESSDEPVYIITDKTPFYAEAGGQVGHTGHIFQTYNNVAEVIDTKKTVGIHYHKCIVKSGVIISQKPAKLEVDSDKRLASARNHTCAHMLQKSLREILGNHVFQKGSLVTPERLRFDFIHSGTIDKQHVQMVEKMVNDNIEKGLSVHTEVLLLEEAMNSGAIALFGEKYPESVRVVTIGDNWSKELCGGEHIHNTLQIKWFKIMGVSSIGSGIKRVEAITGNQVISNFEKEIEKLLEKVTIQQTTIKNLSMKSQEVRSVQKADTSEETFDNGVKFITISLKNMEHKEVMNLIDKQKTNDCKKIVLIINEMQDKCSLSLYTNLNDVNAVEFMRNTAETAGIQIKCGGRNDFAQAGGIWARDIENFIKILKNTIKGFQIKQNYV